MYNQFSSSYDRFVNWPARLAFELPFIDGLLKNAGAHQILDAACGTGQHVLALAKLGYAASGADFSSGMIEQARRNQHTLGLPAEFAVAGFGELQSVFPAGAFDALLCLGNSIPHILNELDLLNALYDFAAVLKPGGLLLLQNRNFDAVLQNGNRWMEPQTAREGSHEWTFVRFYDFLPSGLIDFNIVQLEREGGADWQQQLLVTQLKPWTEEELLTALGESGFGSVRLYGGLDGSDFSAERSGNLIITAKKGS